MKNLSIVILHNKKLLATILLAFALIVSAVVFQGSATAQIDQVRGGIDATGAGPAGVTVDSAIASAINIISFIIGVIAVIMIIIGGLKYITSAGDSQKVESAKNTIIYAVIGLVIVVLAQVIVRYVLTAI